MGGKRWAPAEPQQLPSQLCSRAWGCKVKGSQRFLSSWLTSPWVGHTAPTGAAGLGQRRSEEQHVLRKLFLCTKMQVAGPRAAQQVAQHKVSSGERKRSPRPAPAPCPLNEAITVGFFFPQGRGRISAKRQDFLCGPCAGAGRSHVWSHTSSMEGI